MRDLGLLGTLWALVLFYTGLQVPFTIFLYTGFLRALPRDYEDAALRRRLQPAAGFRRVVFPLLRPITGTVLILNAVFIWNDFFTPLLYLGGSARRPCRSRSSGSSASTSPTGSSSSPRLLIGIAADPGRLPRCSATSSTASPAGLKG